MPKVTNFDPKGPNSEKINKTSYKGYYISDKNDFEKVERHAKELGSTEFKTEYVISKFNSHIQEAYDLMAKNNNITIDIHHPMIRATDGEQYIYFDWLMTGF